MLTKDEALAALQAGKQTAASAASNRAIAKQYDKAASELSASITFPAGFMAAMGFELGKFVRHTVLGTEAVVVNVSDERVVARSITKAGRIGKSHELRYTVSALHCEEWELTDKVATPAQIREYNRYRRHYGNNTSIVQ